MGFLELAQISALPFLAGGSWAPILTSPTLNVCICKRRTRLLSSQRGCDIDAGSTGATSKQLVPNKQRCEGPVAPEHRWRLTRSPRAAHPNPEPAAEGWARDQRVPIPVEMIGDKGSQPLPTSQPNHICLTTKSPRDRDTQRLRSTPGVPSPECPFQPPGAFKTPRPVSHPQVLIHIDMGLGLFPNLPQ